MWSGSVVNVPLDWHICDGSNGTPDLRNRFIVGAGSSYDVGNSGGENAVTLSNPITASNGIKSKNGEYYISAWVDYNSSDYNQFSCTIYKSSDQTTSGIYQIVMPGRNSQTFSVNTPVWLTDTIVALPFNSIDTGNQSIWANLYKIDVSSKNVTGYVGYNSIDDVSTYNDVPSKTIITTLDLGFNNCVVVSNNYIGLLDKTSANCNMIESSKCYCGGARGSRVSSVVEYNNGYYLCLGSDWIFITCS